MPDTQTSPDQPVALGVIGAGIMGQRLLAAAAGQNAVRIAGVWDPSAAAMAGVAAAHPQVSALASADAVIAASDCVYIASPPGSHLALARAALAAGRAVFCEKPLAVDLDDAARFMTEAEGARMAVNFPFTSSPAVAQLQAWLAEGAVGAPGSLAIDVQFARWPRGWQHDAAGWLDAPAQGGFTREVVSHFLFLARRLFGPLSLDRAEAQFPEPGRSERRIAARLRAGPVPVTITGAVGQTAADDANRAEITGPAGAVRLRDWGIAERQDQTGGWQSATLPAHPAARMTALHGQLAAVARLTRGQPHTLATAGDAFDVQRVVEAIVRSVATQPSGKL